MSAESAAYPIEQRPVPVRREPAVPNGVLGMLELLKSNVKGEQATTYLRTAIESASRLDRLFARMLDLVDLEAGSISIEPVTVPVDDIIEDFAARWRRQAIGRGVLFSAESHFAHGAEVSVDTRRVCQIVDELIDNAVRHAGAHRVEVRALPTDDGRLLLEVLDDGSGVPPDRIDELFSTFSQLDSGTAREMEGAGLGLALSRQLARAMGGEVTLAARTDQSGMRGVFELGRSVGPEPSGG